MVDSTAFDLTEALMSRIICQKRTSKNKQFVILYNDFVIKGPYTVSKYKNQITRSKIFSALETPCVVKMIESFKAADGGLYVKFPNLMKTDNVDYEMHTEKFSLLNYRVMKNSLLIDLGHCILENEWIYDNIEDLLVGLCHANILSVGDMNVRNILVDTVNRTVHIIDFDETIISDRDDEVFYFNRPPARRFGWYDKVAPHYNRVADRLMSLINHPIIVEHNLESRVERIVNLLRKYYKPANFTSNDDKNKTDLRNELNISKGQMAWKGMRGGSKTYSGIAFDVAKSALQKYVRRNMTQKAILTAIELFRFGEVGGTAGVSNLFNRVAIIAAEDIGVANIPLVLEVIKTIEAGNRDIYKLLAMVQLLSESSKTRIMSHAWRAYATEDGREIAATKGIKLDTDFNYDERNESLQDILETYKSVFVESDPMEMRYPIVMFIDKLKQHDLNAFSYCYDYMKKYKNIKIEKRRKFILDKPSGYTTKSDILLWKGLSQILDPHIHDILVRAYYNHTENRPFLQFAIMICMYDTSYVKFDVDALTNIWENENNNVVVELLSGKYILEVDPFVIDKHTAIGRGQGRGITEFVEDGAYVQPLNTDYYDETLELIYKQRSK